MRTYESGLTTLELVLVLVFIGVLASLTLPPIARSERRLAAYVAATRFRKDVIEARQRAVLDARTVRVVLDTIAAAYRISDAEGRLLRDHQLARGLRLHTTAHEQTILFSPRGTSNLYSTTSIFVASDPSARVHALRVAPSGAIESR